MPPLQTTQVNVPEGMIDLGIGQPSVSLLPLDALKTATNHRLSQGNAELLAYGADQGDAHFRLALSQFLQRRYRVPVSAGHLMVTCGASQAIDLICTRFTKPGDTIFVEEPTYFLALLIFRDHGLNVVGIPIDEDGLRIDALTDALTRHRPVFVYTIPTFQNPSGVTLSTERREHLMMLASEHDFLVVADEVYHLLDFGPALPHPLASHSGSGHVISLGSFSKICAPGLRLGWVQAAPKILDTLIAAGLLESGGGLNQFTSKIMQSMLEIGEQDTCLDRLKRVYKLRSSLLCEAVRKHLPAVEFAEPDGGFFVWLQLPDNRTAADLLVQAKKNGVSFQPGSRFASSGSLASHLRLSFAYYEVAELVEGVKRLGATLNAQ